MSTTFRVVVTNLCNCCRFFWRFGLSSNNFSIIIVTFVVSKILSQVGIPNCVLSSYIVILRLCNCFQCCGSKVIGILPSIPLFPNLCLFTIGLLYQKSLKHLYLYPSTWKLSHHLYNLGPFFEMWAIVVYISNNFVGDIGWIYSSYNHCLYATIDSIKMYCNRLYLDVILAMITFQAHCLDFEDSICKVVDVYNCKCYT